MAPTMAIATTSVPLRAQSRERRPRRLGLLRRPAAAGALHGGRRGHGRRSLERCAIARRGRLRERRPRRDGRRNARQPVREPGSGRVVGHVVPLDAAPGEGIDDGRRPGRRLGDRRRIDHERRSDARRGPGRGRHRGHDRRVRRRTRGHVRSRCGDRGRGGEVVVRSRVHGLAAGSGFAHRSSAGVGLAAVDRDTSEASPKQAPDHRRQDDCQEHASDQCDCLERHPPSSDSVAPRDPTAPTAGSHLPAPFGRADAVSLSYAGCTQTPPLEPR